jgi:hypothetical protein
MEYNKALAKSLKNTYPNCLIVFGGHHVSPDAADLNDYAFIDILVHGTGEETFRDLLLALNDNRSLDTVANLSFRMENGTTKTTEKNYLIPRTILRRIWRATLTTFCATVSVFPPSLKPTRLPEQVRILDWGELQKKIVFFLTKKSKKSWIGWPRTALNMYIAPTPTSVCLSAMTASRIGLFN